MTQPGTNFCGRRPCCPFLHTGDRCMTTTNVGRLRRPPPTPIPSAHTGTEDISRAYVCAHPQHRRKETSVRGNMNRGLHGGSGRTSTAARGPGMTWTSPITESKSCWQQYKRGPPRTCAREPEIHRSPFCVSVKSPPNPFWRPPW